MFIRYHKDGNYRRDFHHVGKHEIEKDLLYRLKRIGISPGEHLFTGILSNPHSLMGYCLSKKTHGSSCVSHSKNSVLRKKNRNIYS